MVNKFRNPKAERVSGAGTMPAELLTSIPAVTAASVAMLFAALAFSYFWFISPRFAHEGFSYAPSTSRLTISVILTAVSVFVLPKNLSRPRDIFILLLFITPVLPSYIFYGLAGGDRDYTIFVAISFIIVSLFSKIKLKELPRPLTPFSPVVVSMLLVSISMAAIFADGLFSNFNLSLYDVYDHRAAVSESGLGNGAFSYILGWAPKLGTGALIIYAISKRSLSILLFGLFCQFLFFATLNHRAFIFYPIAIMGIAVAYRFRARSWMVLSGCGAIAFLATVSYILWGEFWTGTLYTYRIFFLPTLINYGYHDLFQDYGHTYLSTGALRRFIDYPFFSDPPYLVADYLFNTPEVMANTGFLGTAYMHFGFPGMVGFALIIGLLIALADALASQSSLGIGLATGFLFPAYFDLILSADLLTAIVTHGLALTLLMLWLWKRPNPKQGNAQVPG